MTPTLLNKVRAKARRHRATLREIVESLLSEWAEAPDAPRRPASDS